MGTKLANAPDPGAGRASRVMVRQKLIQSAVRFGAHAIWDGVTRPRARTKTDIPFAIEAISTDWLTAVLCENSIGTKVVGFEFGPQTSGTTVRRRIDLHYSTDNRNTDLPISVFAKSSPRFVNRLTLGLTKTIENEALFYRNIRPRLTLEAPRGYYSAYDLESGRSIHLLEDLVATKGATFCSPSSIIDRSKAEDVVKVLAALHGTFFDYPNLSSEFPWLQTFPDWWRTGYEGFGLRRYHDEAINKAASVIPRDILYRRAEIWPAQIRSLQTHLAAPVTLIHGDVHLGNWYFTRDGRMGLCDWQCVSIGNWARDFAYAVSATLRIEDRRAWERDLLALYLREIEVATGRTIAYADAWKLYRQQTIAALLMWTPTLCHSPLMADMQPEEVSMEMIKRITTAMSDLDALSAV